MLLCCPSEGARGNGHKLKFVKSYLNVRELCYCEGGQILEQLAQRVCGVSILREIQNLRGHSPEEPALGDPALTCSPEMPSNLSPSVIP